MAILCLEADYQPCSWEWRRLIQRNFQVQHVLQAIAGDSEFSRAHCDTVVAAAATADSALRDIGLDTADGVLNQQKACIEGSCEAIQGAAEASTGICHTAG